MKKFIPSMKQAIVLFLLFLSVCAQANAQCVAKIQDVKEGPGGVLLVGTEYVYNGKAEPNIDWITYLPEKFVEKTLSEKVLLIKEDINNRCKEIIMREYVKTHDYPEVEMRKEIVAAEIDKIKKEIVGIEVSQTSTEISLDSDGDGVNDKTAEINSNAQKTLSNIAP